MAMGSSANDAALLSKPAADAAGAHAMLERAASTYTPLPTFALPTGEQRHYQQQYADMYFARLAALKPAAAEAAVAAGWSEFSLGGERARRVDRVLDVRQGQLCWVVGTAYLDLPLKPNVLDDLGKEHWIAAPPPRETYAGADGAGGDVMLEDESGRLRLAGGMLESMLLVTGTIVAVIGTENKDGDFEVLDIKMPDLPRQPARWEKEDGIAAVKGKSVTQDKPKGGKVAIVSGLNISGDAGDSLALDLLTEWLLGEAADAEDQQNAASISRLIVAGNSLANGSPILSREEVAAAALKNRGQRKYGYDSSAYNAAPTDQLDLFLSTLLPSLPITLIPGASDPTSTQLPQQPIHAAMFPHSRSYMPAPGESSDGQKPSPWLDSTTNPFEAEIDGWRVAGQGGQALDDVHRYVGGEARAPTMEALLRWRLAAPTAPDTLWCYPFQDGDAFVIRECPHLFLAGNQPRFETAVIDGPQGQAVRLIAIPPFSETGEVVVVDMETLEPEVVRFEVWGE